MSSVNNAVLCNDEFTNKQKAKSLGDRIVELGKILDKQTIMYKKYSSEAKRADVCLVISTLVDNISLFQSVMAWIVPTYTEVPITVNDTVRMVEFLKTNYKNEFNGYWHVKATT